MTNTQNNWQWVTCEIIPQPGEWICFRSLDENFLTGGLILSNRYTVAQIIRVNKSLESRPIMLLKGDENNHNAFDSIPWSELQNVHVFQE